MIYNNSNEITKAIRTIMKEKKITINELSQRLNKSQSATSQLFRMKNISLDTLNDISNAIGYNIDINFIENKQEGE